MMSQLEQLRQWYHNLPPRDLWLVNLTAALLAFTLFYVLLWEPVHKGLEEETLRHESQQKLLRWMQQSAREVQALRANGRQTLKQTNLPVSLVLEQSLKNAGLKAYVEKIEASGSGSARVKLNNAPFDQMLVWLRTIERHNGIHVGSAQLERGEKPGTASGRLSLKR